ncbi:MAG TPA: helix-turn-helix domain-containing protein, partial [Gemmataceae bacterium]|nr:helix-turn-helix domain-containing protein [Gemmataceae bacterium]
MEHLADFEAALLAKGVTAKQVRQVAYRARRVLVGCGFVFMDDLSSSRTTEYLASLRESDLAVPALDPGKTSFTPSETARLLGVGPEAVRSAVKRHRLEASGKGPARRYPRATVEALLDRHGRGASVQTANFYL